MALFGTVWYATVLCSTKEYCPFLPREILHIWNQRVQEMVVVCHMKTWAESCASQHWKFVLTFDFAPVCHGTAAHLGHRG